MAGHGYFIAVGDGDLVGFERSCLGTFALKADPTHYTSVAQEPTFVVVLLEATKPHFSETYCPRRTACR